MWDEIIEIFKSVNNYEISLIREQMVFADGVSDLKLEAWKSILDKVRKYNEEHE